VLNLAASEHPCSPRRDVPCGVGFLAGFPEFSGIMQADAPNRWASRVNGEPDGAPNMAVSLVACNYDRTSVTLHDMF
jgi:hypothetical protein